MRRLLATTALAATLLGTCLSAPAAQAAEGVSIRTATAGELADNCGVNPREPAADARINFCRGFAQGAIEVELHDAGEKKPFCFPSPAPSRAETMSQFVAWVKAMPDRRAMPSAAGLFRFLGERFPCK